jgi:hypothetical protein
MIERAYCERHEVWLVFGGDPHTGCAISGCLSHWEATDPE